jgi:hypothetical protein
MEIYFLYFPEASKEEGKKLWRSGEARRRESQEVGRHRHMQKSNEKHTLYIACKTKCLGPPYAL